MGAARRDAPFDLHERSTARLSRVFLCSLRERWLQLSARRNSSAMHVCGAAEYSATHQSPSGAGLVALVVLLCVGAIALACLVRVFLRRRRMMCETPTPPPPLAARSPLAPDVDDEVEPSSPTTSEAADSPRPLRSALKRTSAVLAAARAREQAAAARAANAAAALRPSLDGGAMSTYDQWQAQQGLAGRTLSFTLFRSPDDSEDDGASNSVLITLKDELGRGRYGEVLAASWQRRGAVVVKALTLPGLKRIADADLARIASLRHPNLLRLLGVASLPEVPLLLLLPRSSHGSLAALLRAEAGAGTASRLSWPRRAAIAAGVASGLAYLHAQQPPIPHGDCKADNVMLTDDCSPLLADANLLNCRPDGVFPVGTPLYAPPEVAEGMALPVDLLAADVYCFGSAILHQLAHAGVAAAESFTSPLYRAMALATTAGVAAEGSASTLKWDPLQAQFARSQEGWMPELAQGCPAAMATAISSCCAATPAARPTAKELHVEISTWPASAHEW